MSTPVEAGQRRILFAHAHPDDETVGTGATMARYAAEGAQVTLVTSTLGEEGEIHVPALSGLLAAEADQLGGYRLVELERACAALGVSDHRFLGGAGAYRDSGMMGTPANDHPRAFWRTDVDTAARHLLEIIREVRPQVVVTYDENGGYGHPDHIQTHRVCMRAVELAAAEGIGPAKVYWSGIPRSVIKRGMEEFALSADNPFEGFTDVEDLPFAVADELIVARVDAGRYADAKFAAIAAHATQIAADSWLAALAGNAGAEIIGVEYYMLPIGTKGPVTRDDGLEDDLFAGVELTAVPSSA